MEQDLSIIADVDCCSMDFEQLPISIGEGTDPSMQSLTQIINVTCSSVSIKQGLKFMSRWTRIFN